MLSFPPFLVPSQCILARTLSKKQQLMSVVTKVAMQINCKLGGELWALEIPVSQAHTVFSKRGLDHLSEESVSLLPIANSIKPN